MQVNELNNGHCTDQKEEYFSRFAYMVQEHILDICGVMVMVDHVEMTNRDQRPTYGTHQKSWYSLVQLQWMLKYDRDVTYDKTYNYPCQHVCPCLVCVKLGEEDRHFVNDCKALQLINL